ncbi:MAG TPA: hypothetical protein VFS03_00975, partial [Microvirga sp.]|nr:hypothetical protein [Microvirga sp.]
MTAGFGRPCRAILAAVQGRDRQGAIAAAHRLLAEPLRDDPGRQGRDPVEEVRADEDGQTQLAAEGFEPA